MSAVISTNSDFSLTAAFLYGLADNQGANRRRRDQASVYSPGEPVHRYFKFQLIFCRSEDQAQHRALRGASLALASQSRLKLRQIVPNDGRIFAFAAGSVHLNAALSAVASGCRLGELFAYDGNCRIT